MRTRYLVTVAVVVASSLGLAPASHAQEDCSRAVIFMLPGVTWSDVNRAQPPNLLRVMDSGASGSVSVRTNSSRTSYASGFATVGAGTRVEGGTTTGGQIEAESEGFVSGVTAAGWDELQGIAAEDGYDAVPGALGEALGEIPTIAIGNAELSVPPNLALGYERWSLLTAMDASGKVDLAAVGLELLTSEIPVRTDEAVLKERISEAMQEVCALTVIDQGDLIRTELRAGSHGPTAAERDEALQAADRALGVVTSALDEDDLLIAVSPTSPLHGPVRFGVALASGPAFPAGTLLSSASTRREGVVTLPDIAPTVLEHMGFERHPAMLGRPLFTVDTDRDRLAMAIQDDSEAVFVDEVRTPITTAFVVVQVVIYIAIAWILRRRRGRGGEGPARWLEAAALAVVAFPMCTYLTGVISQHSLGTWGFTALLLGCDLISVAIVVALFRHPLDRLLALTGATCLVLVLDVVTGAALQVNTVFSYSPLVAGRFAGFGNTAFSVLGAAAIITGSLLVQRSRRSHLSLMAAAALFVVVVVADGAPAWGSDVGGVLAFVPAFGITLLLLAGKRPTSKAVGLGLMAAAMVLGVFLLFDLARTPDERTHLARLFEDIRARGFGALADTIGRKISTNLRVFTSTIWTYFVPPALAFIAWLLLRPKNRWEELAVRYPTLRAGLIGGLVLCVLGFAVNDSGIVVPAMVLSYLVPVALLAHLLLERESV